MIFFASFLLLQLAIAIALIIDAATSDTLALPNRRALANKTIDTSLDV